MSSYPSTPTATSNNTINTFSGLKQNISYDIKVEVTDNAGNVGTGTITNLQNGNVVYARLWDETNAESPDTLNVQDATPPKSPDDMAKNPTDYFGDTVNYTPKNNANVKWKIFYVGTNPNVKGDTTNRIYLIADGYINAKYAPNGKGGTAIDSSNTYLTWFQSIVDYGNDYRGSSDITNSLVKPWLSYLNSYPSSTNNNMKAVAYMLDTDVWSTFTDSAGKAEYAIRGPTLDLFCASYNKKYSSKQIQYESQYYGYAVKWSTDSNYDYSNNSSIAC